MCNILGTSLLVDSGLHCTSLNLRSLLNASYQGRWLRLHILYSILRHGRKNGNILGFEFCGILRLCLKGIVRLWPGVLLLLFRSKLLNSLLSQRLPHIPERHRWRELKIMRHLEPVIVGIKLNVGRNAEHCRFSRADARNGLLKTLPFLCGLLNIFKEAEIG